MHHVIVGMELTGDYWFNLAHILKEKERNLSLSVELLKVRFIKIQNLRTITYEQDTAIME